MLEVYPRNVGKNLNIDITRRQFGMLRLFATEFTYSLAVSKCYKLTPSENNLRGGVWTYCSLDKDIKVNNAIFRS
jgi:hypothetical protein